MRGGSSPPATGLKIELNRIDFLHISKSTSMMSRNDFNLYRIYFSVSKRLCIETTVHEKPSQRCKMISNVYHRSLCSISYKTILCWTIIVDLAPKTSMCFHLILRQKTLRLMIAGTCYFLASMIRRREPLIVGARTIHIITNLKRMTRWRQPLTQARPIIIIIHLNKFMNNNCYTEE